ncbi:urea transporter [bacterium LRH843]|nr:urea transporter [bacterium LRH843]
MTLFMLYEHLFGLNQDKRTQNWVRFITSESLKGIRGDFQKERFMMETNRYNFLSPVHLLSVILKGISQVFLIENAFTGLIILFGIAIASPKLAIIAFTSSLIGTLIGTYFGGDKALTQIGLYGYNSVLTGLAIVIYMDDIQRWFIALVGAAIAAVMMAAMLHVTKNLDIPVLTFPFIVVTSFFLLATYHLQIFELSPIVAPQPLDERTMQLGGNPNFIKGLIKGISEVFIIDSFWTGICMLLGLFWAGWRYGVYVVLGTIVSWLTAYYLGAEITLINLGLYCYNAVLTIIAVELTYGRTKLRPFPFTGTIAAIITVPVTASINTLFLPLGLPTLTMPFVLCTWFFLSARNILPKL